jgi:hypothetical protein
VSQLDIISKSLLLLEQRISTNEDQVAQVLDYFREVREHNQSQQQHHQSISGFPLSFNQNAMNQHPFANPGAFREDYDTLKQTMYQVEQQVRIVNEQMNPSVTNNKHHQFEAREDVEDDAGAHDDDLRRD